MEVYIELSKKTTILFSPHLHARLSALADQKSLSLGELVRDACEKQYGLHPKEPRLAAVRELATLSLPAAEVQTMKAEAVLKTEEMLP